MTMAASHTSKKTGQLWGDEMTPKQESTTSCGATACVSPQDSQAQLWGEPTGPEFNHQKNVSTGVKQDCETETIIHDQMGEMHIGGSATAAPGSERGEQVTTPDETRKNMLVRVAMSDAHFRHQQRGEPDLDYQEKMSIATKLLDEKPGIFLSRFNKYLELEDLEYFDSMKDDYTIGFYMEEVRKMHDDRKSMMKTKNRRYQAMLNLESAGSYFSDEEMKRRDPLMYEQLVGQYLTEEEVQAQVDKSDLRFTSILLRHIQVQQDTALYNMQKEAEEDQMEEEDEDSDEQDFSEDLDDDGHKNPSDISEDERHMMRQELVNLMKQRFLSGEDQEFDYREVDENAEYDTIDIDGQDLEEKYFDEQEPELAADVESSASSASHTPTPGGSVGDVRLSSEDVCSNEQKTCPNSRTKVSPIGQDCDTEGSIQAACMDIGSTSDDVDPKSMHANIPTNSADSDTLVTSSTEKTVQRTEVICDTTETNEQKMEEG